MTARRNVLREACPEWLEKAICHCGCQQSELKHKFSPESQTWTMNWASPKWLSQVTQALLDGYLPADYDPAIRLPRPRLANEYWLGDRQVSAEEFERTCVESAEQEKRELDRHVQDSAENFLSWINQEESGARTLQNLRDSEVGALAACVLTLDKERKAAASQRRVEARR